MPRVCSKGFQVDSGTANLSRARVRGTTPAEGIMTSRRGLEARSWLHEPSSQPDTWMLARLWHCLLTARKTPRTSQLSHAFMFMVLSDDIMTWQRASARK